MIGIVARWYRSIYHRVIGWVDHWMDYDRNRGAPRQEPMMTGAPDFLELVLTRTFVLVERRFRTIEPGRHIWLFRVQMLLRWIRLTFVSLADLAVPWIVFEADELLP